MSPDNLLDNPSEESGETRFREIVDRMALQIGGQAANDIRLLGDAMVRASTMSDSDADDYEEETMKPISERLAGLAKNDKNLSTALEGIKLARMSLLMPIDDEEEG